MNVHPAGPLHAGITVPPETAGPRPLDAAGLDELAPAVWPRNAARGEGGALEVDGVDVRDLAERYGTPLFVIDEADFRSRAAEFATAFGAEAVHYAAKAFLCNEVARWVAEEGLSLDVAGVGRVVLDSFHEIARLDAVARERGVVVPVMVRLTVGVEAHTHEFIATAHEDQKFGFSMAGGEASAAAEAVRRVLAARGLALEGLHSHIGSQIFDTEGFEVAAHRVVRFLAKLHKEHGGDALQALTTLDLGGGFGIAYRAEETPVDVPDLAEELRGIVKRECHAEDLDVPQIAVEPGRAIAGPAGITLYTVGTLKDVPLGGSSARRYVSVDGGMSDNIRTALYDAVYDCRLVSRSSERDGSGDAVLSRVVGKHCESGDVVVRDCWLPADLAPGDLLAVAATGAYCYSMASSYNRLPRPAVVAVRDGQARALLRRETLEDQFRLEGAL